MNLPWDDEAFDAMLRRGLKARPEPAASQDLAARAAALATEQERAEKAVGAHLARWLARRRLFNALVATAAAALLVVVLTLGASRVATTVSSMSGSSESITAAAEQTSGQGEAASQTTGDTTNSSTSTETTSSSSQTVQTMLLAAGVTMVGLSVWAVQRGMGGGQQLYGGLEVYSLR